MRKRYRFLAMVLLLSVLLAGCGDALFEITDEEQEIITTYSAYAVAMHNTFQKDGLVTLDMRLLEEEEPAPEPEADSEAAAGGNTSNTSAGGTGQQEQKSEPEQASMTLAEAIGQGKKLKISYKGYEVVDSYQEGKAYSVAAPEGKTFLVAKLKLKNTTDEAVKVDNGTLDVTYRCCYNEADTVNAESTFLTKDFTTYDGTIKAGKSVNAVIFFPIPADAKKQIKNITMSVVIEGTESLIKL